MGEMTGCNMNRAVRFRIISAVQADDAICTRMAGGGYLRKNDFILIIIVIVAAAVSALFIAFIQGSDGAAVRVTIDGALYGEYSLSEKQSVFIGGESGYNRLVIENGSAYMSEADCPDGYCMDYQPISRSGETIICLPHRLVVEVTGDRDAQLPDVIVP